MEAMENIPDEILSKIFEFVPTRRRRESIRLVCRRWNRVCNDYVLTKEDVLTLDPPYDFYLVVPFLKPSQRKFYNLCFVHQQIGWTEDEISFWKSRGDVIESICFKNTLLNFIDLKIIFEYCPKLKKLSIQCNATKFVKKLLENFEEYACMNFTISSVSSFQLSLQDHCMNLFTNYSLQKIMATFPNIESLEIRLPFSCMNSEDASISFNSKEHITAPGVIDTIQSVGRNLKHLCLRLSHICCCHTSKFVDVSKMLPYLEKIEDLKIFTFSFLDHILFQSSMSSMQLTKVTLLNVPLTYTKYFTKDFIMLILNTFTNLHTLQLDQIKEIEIDDILLQKLLLSALKELNLYIRHFSIRATTGIFENFMANHTLETLTLCVTGTRGEKYENLFAIFVQNFLNIRDLTIHFPTDTIMQHIFKYQKNLKNLRLENCYECPKLGLPGVFVEQSMERIEDTYSICDLKDLELLHINVCNTESLLYDKNLSFLVLPKLKNFELKNFNNSSIGLREVQSYEAVLSVTCYKELIKALKNSPNVEYLKLQFCRAMTQIELEQLLDPLKHLRQIFIKDSCLHTSRCRCEKQLMYNHEKLFEICPSLRRIIHNYIRFYPDVIKKRIEIYPKDFRDFMTTSSVLWHTE